MYTRQKTHQRVLPQPAALKSVSADKLRDVHETGYGRNRNTVTPGVQHGRGETSFGWRHSGGEPSEVWGLAAPDSPERRAPTTTRQEGHPAMDVTAVPGFLPALKGRVSALDLR